MAIPACPKCSGNEFQSTVQTPKEAGLKILLHHCASCGCVVGATQSSDIGVLSDELSRKLERLIVAIRA